MSAYIHLKHALADAALIAIQQRRRAALAAWLAAYCERARDGAFHVALADVTRAAREKAAACRLPVPRALAADVQDLHLFTPLRGDAVALRPEFHAHAAYMRRQVTRLWRAVTRLRQDPALRVIPRDVRLGTVFFDAGLYFECHEYLEGVWKRGSLKEKGFYHGFVQVGAAFYHFEKGNMHGARTLLRKGLEKLAACGPVHQGMDVREFRRRLAPWLAFFEGAGARPPAMPAVPTLPAVSAAPGTSRRRKHPP